MFQCRIAHMRIALRCLDVVVSEQLLDITNIYPVFEEMSRKAVPE